MRIVVLADSDSYVKWGAALAGRLGPEWERELLVVRTPEVVSDAQLDAALVGSGIGTVARVGYRDLAGRLAASPPDAVLVATPGPVARVLVRLVAALEPRPVVVTGLPGISIPATTKALRFRRQADLMVLHSRREIADFTELAVVAGIDVGFGLASLPFAERRPAAGTDLVFAAQAIVPEARADRLELACVLRDAALAHPDRRVVVKLRARPGERQTHAERDDYPGLLDELGPWPANLVVSTAAMADALDTAEGLVTVSSTAAIEAVARGIPIIAFDGFGVDPALINTVFAGSGVFGGRDDVLARRFRHPLPAWLADNYFHAEAEADWAARLEELVVARRVGGLAPRMPGVALGGRAREAWDRKRAFGGEDRTLGGYAALVVGTPLRAARRAARALTRRGSRTRLAA